MMGVDMILRWIQSKISDLGLSARPLGRKRRGRPALVPKYKHSEDMAARAHRLSLLHLLTQDRIDPLTLKEMLEDIR